MPRYLPAEQITCPVMTTTVVPIVNSKTGVQVTELSWPEALTSTGELYATSGTFIAGLQRTLVGNVTAALSADGVSVTLVHDQFFTPPANVGIWPRVPIRILNEGGQNQCPFVGPVTGPQGGSFGSRASLIRSIDANDPTAYYVDATGAAERRAHSHIPKMLASPRRACSRRSSSPSSATICRSTGRNRFTAPATVSISRARRWSAGSRSPPTRLSSQRAE